VQMRGQEFLVVSEHTLAHVTDTVTYLDVGDGATNVKDNAGSFMAERLRVEASPEGSEFLKHVLAYRSVSCFETCSNLHIQANSLDLNFCFGWL
jgi:hypothetical protein